MDGKTIKQIADELRVSKQAVWQRVKRSEELSAMLADHSENINGTIHVDDVLEQRIKEQYPKQNTPEAVDDTSVNIDETTVKSSETVDETSGNIDVNTLIATLQNTVDTLQQQLEVKDKQIDELTAMLKSSQEQQATLTTALNAAQALHAATVQERLTERSGASDGSSEGEEIETEQKRKGFFARIFGRKDK